MIALPPQVQEHALSAFDTTGTSPPEDYWHALPHRPCESEPERQERIRRLWVRENDLARTIRAKARPSALRGVAREEWDRVCGENWPRLVRGVRFRGFSKHDAEDIVQRAIERICKGEKWRKCRFPRAWLSRSVTNVLNRSYRKAERRNELSYRVSDGLQADGLVRVSAGKHVHRDTRRDTLHREVAEALACSDHEELAAGVLQGMTLAELATAHGICEKTVARRLRSLAPRMAGLRETEALMYREEARPLPTYEEGADPEHEKEGRRRARRMFHQLMNPKKKVRR